MKKSLLAVALLSALPVIAQAQTSVTLYGRIDNAIAYEKPGGPGTGGGVLMQSGVQGSNRWGLRGSEDLGGGLKAVFNVEGGFNADTGGTNPSSGTVLFNRRSVVGLDGGFGTLLLGRDYDPLFYLLSSTDPLALGHYGNLNNVFGSSLSGGTAMNGTTSNAYGVRISNGVHYTSPSLGGLTARLAYGFGEAANAVGTAPFTTPKNNGRSMGANLTWAGGGLTVGAAIRQNDVASNAALPTTLYKNRHWGVSARYTFNGVFGVNAGFGKNDYGFTPYTSNQLADSKMYWLGADVAIGNGKLILQGSRIDPKGPAQATIVGLTYNYALSKRTTVYATGGKTWNNSSANVTLSTSSTDVGPIPGPLGADPLGVALGVGHNF